MENNTTLSGLGYTQPLYILPFDHRTGLYKLFGWTEPLADEQINNMKSGRRLIFDAILQAVAQGVPKENTPVFTDDIYGKEVLLEAAAKGFMTFLTTEKSGIPYFDFEHGENFKTIISEINPTFTKALVRFNPEGNQDDNAHSLQNLKKLSDFSHENGYKFVIEPLVAATEEQLASVSGNKALYDETVRPSLTVRMIEHMHTAGIEPDIWKIEGFKNSENYQAVVNAARSGARSEVGIISLGRNETDETVSQWLKAGAAVDGVIGFAIGRTIFLDALTKFQSGDLDHDSAVTEIANRFVHFYKVFTEK